LPNVPTPTGLTVGKPAPNGLSIPSELFTAEENRTTWEGRITAFEPTANEFFGRCYLVLGELSPTDISEGRLVTSAFDELRFGGIASGRHIDTRSGFGCDTADAEARGYQPLIEAEVPVGATYKFFETLVVPEVNTGRLTQITIADVRGENAIVFDVS